MVMNNGSEWVTDVMNMTCRNTSTNIVVMFKKIDGNIIGEIKDLPHKIISEWTAEGIGNTSIKNAVIEAETSFLKAYSRAV